MHSEESYGTVSTFSIQIVWEIENFTDLPSNKEFLVTSPHFVFRGQEWKLLLWPNYYHDGICVNIYRKGPSVAVPGGKGLEWNCSLKRENGTNLPMEKHFADIHHYLDEACPDWKSVFALRSVSRSCMERESLLPDGRLILFCSFSIGMEAVNAYIQTESIDNVLTLSQNLKDLHLAGKDCDVTINVRNESFGAHRAILAARTPVLAAMFCHNMSETQTGVICVEDCDPKAFAVFLLFVYSGAVENLTADNVALVYYIADKYDTPELKELCVRYMSSTFSVDTICNILSTADRHSEAALLERATEFFHQNAGEIFPTTEWETFMVENTTLAKGLIIGSLKHASRK